MAEQATYLFSTQTSKDLAEKIAKHYGQELGKINFQQFSDGEFEPVLDQSVRGGRVFIIGSTFPPADNLLELLLMIDAAKRASAKNITVVIPYYGLARQDRKDKPRAPIGAKLVANLLTAAGSTRVMTMDLHADQIQGFFEIPVDHLYASTIFIDYIRELNIENLTIASPDMGGAKRARNYATHGVFSGKAYENIENSALEEVIVTDSIPVKLDKTSKIKVLSCAPLFADVMKSVHSHQSISNKFII